MSRRRCLRCQTIYEGDARFCPRDGSPLVDVGPAKAKPQSPSKPMTALRQAVKRERGPSVDAAAALKGQVLDSRYRVLRRLGEGGMSFVYEARDITSGENVAVKVLSPKLAADKNAMERLRREAGLAMRLNHPNACPIIRFGETEDGLIYLVMPYLPGELLSDRETRVGPMDLKEGVDLLVQICAGLHHAHGLHIIHRDLKPENVMLVPNDEGTESAVVMDFGLAKDKSTAGGAHKLTATGIVLGTPEFMSPEQVRGRELDPRSDVYALAIVAFEMFTGNLPFNGRTPQEMMIARLRGSPASLRQYRPDLPARLDKVLRKAMEAQPGDRYATALEFGEALGGANDDGFLAKLKSSLS
jgi:eukaryotic-like serine/threonine-protein kinase